MVLKYNVTYAQHLTILTSHLVPHIARKILDYARKPPLYLTVVLKRPHYRRRTIVRRIGYVKEVSNWFDNLSPHYTIWVDVFALPYYIHRAYEGGWGDISVLDHKVFGRTTPETSTTDLPDPA